MDEELYWSKLEKKCTQWLKEKYPTKILTSKDLSKEKPLYGYLLKLSRKEHQTLEEYLKHSGYTLEYYNFNRNAAFKILNNTYNQTQPELAAFFNYTHQNIQASIQRAEKRNIIFHNIYKLSDTDKIVLQKMLQEKSSYYENGNYKAKIICSLNDEIAIIINDHNELRFFFNEPLQLCDELRRVFSREKTLKEYTENLINTFKKEYERIAKIENKSIVTMKKFDQYQASYTAYFYTKELNMPWTQLTNSVGFKNEPKSAKGKAADLITTDKLLVMFKSEYEEIMNITGKNVISIIEFNLNTKSFSSHLYTSRLKMTWNELIGKCGYEVNLYQPQKATWKYKTTEQLLNEFKDEYEKIKKKLGKSTLSANEYNSHTSIYRSYILIKVLDLKWTEILSQACS